MRLLIILAFILTLLQFSCTSQMDAKRDAEVYCNCMEKNGFPDRRIYAATICHAEMLKRSRFYRVFFIDKRDEELSKNLAKSTLDSVQLYMRTFVRNIPISMRESAAEVIMSTMDMNLRTGKDIHFLMDQEMLLDTNFSESKDSVKMKNGLIYQDDWLTEYYYKNGKKNGVFKNYFKRNRRLHVLGFYKDDAPVGTWYFFNQDGGLYLIEDIKGLNKNKEVRRSDGVMVKPPFMSYRKEYDPKTGEIKREGLALFYKNVEDGFYRYGSWKKY
ncbi:MAG: hypothetical protein P0Y49_04935 [Candidatus Pedobacter colombiensis]|uniref:MORN repeat variant n=1 Tax=Candidatus Pedobacter colombiensis TaxID=3121371 RepID=A0AAJ5W9G1_9SPHI|nr:hypothetical protein [Pedobacter sp.]WEK20482.1 MAG: hypothetical protein P0Y49_04935 [Pedobacter sp.]